MITPNSDDVEQKEFKQVAAGTYGAKVLAAEAVEGTYGPQLKISWQLLAGDHEFANQIINDWLPLAGKHEWVFERFHLAPPAVTKTPQLPQRLDRGAP